jgi:hypothetical protein
MARYSQMGRIDENILRLMAAGNVEEARGFDASGQPLRNTAAKPRGGQAGIMFPANAMPEGQARQIGTAQFPAEQAAVAPGIQQAMVAAGTSAPTERSEFEELARRMGITSPAGILELKRDVSRRGASLGRQREIRAMQSEIRGERAQAERQAGAVARRAVPAAIEARSAESIAAAKNASAELMNQINADVDLAVGRGANEATVTSASLRSASRDFQTTTEAETAETVAEINAEVERDVIAGKDRIAARKDVLARHTLIQKAKLAKGADDVQTLGIVFDALVDLEKAKSEERIKGVIGTEKGEAVVGPPGAQPGLGQTLGALSGAASTARAGTQEAVPATAEGAAPTETGIPGDLNNDGKFDAADMQLRDQQIRSLNNRLLRQDLTPEHAKRIELKLASLQRIKPPPTSKRA